MNAPDFRLRGTGRTTKLLDLVCEMLNEGMYTSAVFVVHNAHFIRYAVMLVQHHCQSSALFNHAANKLSFRNRYGQLVHIQFVPMEREFDLTRGYRNPIAHDHEVTRLRGLPMNLTNRRVTDELLAAGIDPFADIHIHKTSGE